MAQILQYNLQTKAQEEVFQEITSNFQYPLFSCCGFARLMGRAATALCDKYRHNSERQAVKSLLVSVNPNDGQLHQQAHRNAL